MRRVRSRLPHRQGGGPLFRGVTRVVAAAAITVALVGTPATAAQVTVKFRYAVGSPQIGRVCPVSVSAGSGGIRVLNAARAKGCILSYKAEYYPGLGHLIRCINWICQIDLVGTYWAMYENGRYTSYGVDGFRANVGDELAFVYRKDLRPL